MVSEKDIIIISSGEETKTESISGSDEAKNDTTADVRKERGSGDANMETWNIQNVPGSSKTDTMVHNVEPDPHQVENENKSKSNDAAKNIERQPTFVILRDDVSSGERDDNDENRNTEQTEMVTITKEVFPQKDQNNTPKSEGEASTSSESKVETSENNTEKCDFSISGDHPCDLKPKNEQEAVIAGTSIDASKEECSVIDSPMVEEVLAADQEEKCSTKTKEGNFAGKRKFEESEGQNEHLDEANNSNASTSAKHQKNRIIKKILCFKKEKKSHIFG